MFGELESVLQMDGERHHRVRRLMNPSFSAASMEVLKADIQRILGEKLDQIETNGPEFDAMTDFSQDLVERVDRKSGVSGKGVSVRVDLGGCRTIKKKKKK